MTPLSQKEIGREFDDRDHSTVLSSLSRVEKLVKSDPNIAEVVKDITANVNAHFES